MAARALLHAILCIEPCLCSTSAQLSSGLFVLVSGKLDGFFLRTSRQLVKLASEAGDLEQSAPCSLALIKAKNIPVWVPTNPWDELRSDQEQPVCLDRERMPLPQPHRDLCRHFCPLREKK